MRRPLVPWVAYAVRGFSGLIADAMSTLNELTESPDGTPGFEAVLGADEEVEGVELLPQPAATMAATAARPSRAGPRDRHDHGALTGYLTCIRPLPPDPESTHPTAPRSGGCGRRVDLSSNVPEPTAWIVGGVERVCQQPERKSP